MPSKRFIYALAILFAIGLVTLCFFGKSPIAMALFISVLLGVVMGACAWALENESYVLAKQKAAQEETP